MLVGALRCRPVTGKVTGLRNAEAIRKMPGVRAVVQAPDAAIVVAQHYWQAEGGRRAGTGDRPRRRPGLHSDAITAARVAALGAPGAVVATHLGSPEDALAKAKMVEADYHALHRARDHGGGECHRARARRCHRGLGPDQGQDFVRNALARLFNRQPESVIVHTTFTGGSFGRKFLPTSSSTPRAASAAVGQPVKVIRSREDDIRHGFYRPGVSGRFRAVLDAQGMPLAMHARVTGQSLYGVIRRSAWRRTAAGTRPCWRRSMTRPTRCPT